MGGGHGVCVGVEIQAVTSDRRWVMKQRKQQPVLGNGACRRVGACVWHCPAWSSLSESFVLTACLEVFKN